MRGIDKYIIGQLVPPLVFITLTLTGVAWLTQSLRYVDTVIKGLPAGAFIQITLLVLPSVVGFTLLIGLFLAVLYTYHRMNTDSEIIVMWSAGLDGKALAKPALILSVLIVAVLYFLGLYLSPYSARAIKDLRYEWQESISALPLQEGVFNTIGESITIYIRARETSGELRGILVHDNSDPEKPVTYMAESGALIRTADGPRFVMVNGNVQEVAKERGQLSLLYFDSFPLDLGSFIKPASKRWRAARERYLGELFFPEDPDLTDYRRREFLLEAHERLVRPLYGFLFVLIALASLLSGEHARRGKTLRIAAAAGIAFAVFIFGSAISHAAQENSWLIPFMYLNVILSGALAGYVLIRGRFRHRQPTPPLSKEMA